MLPFRYSSIFRSRWIALLWAAGIIWTAVDVAGSPDAEQAKQTSAAGADAEQAKQAEQLLQNLSK